MWTSLAYFGELNAIVTAVIWAFAVILFRKSGEAVHPVGLNLFKNVLAIALLLPTLWIIGGKLYYNIPVSDYAILFFSGALGIGISDTLFFMCLNRIGAGLTAIVDCLYSPFIIGLSIIFLGENLSVTQIFGTIMIISAVMTAIQKGNQNSTDRRAIIAGIVFGVLAMLTVAISIVSVKPILERLPLVWVSTVRMVAGLITLLVILPFYPRRREIIKSIASAERWGYTLSGSFLGTYVALILWLASMKFTLASIAAALHQTSSIFVFIFAALLLKEPINLRRCLGIAMAAIGSFLVMFY